MSVQRRGDGWRIRWREGGQQRSRQFARKSDAQAFEREIKCRQALGPLAATVLVSGTTLTDFVRAEWWPKYAVPNLKPSTRRRYAEV